LVVPESVPVEVAGVEVGAGVVPVAVGASMMTVLVDVAVRPF
jgi:hypothetical protein